MPLVPSRLSAHGQKLLVYTHPIVHCYKGNNMTPLELENRKRIVRAFGIMLHEIGTCILKLSDTDDDYEDAPMSGMLAAVLASVMSAVQAGYQAAGIDPMIALTCLMQELHMSKSSQGETKAQNAPSTGAVN